RDDLVTGVQTCALPISDQQTILLVDDSENDLELMKIAFRRAGLNSPLQVVHSGEEAIAYLAGEGQYSDRNRFPLPAVMLLDLNRSEERRVGKGCRERCW